MSVEMSIVIQNVSSLLHLFVGIRCLWLRAQNLNCHFFKNASAHLDMCNIL